MVAVSNWVQPRGNPAARVTIPHATAASQEWSVEGTYTFFEGRRFPVGARSDQVTNTWTVTASWSAGERAGAEAFIELLRGAATGTDARLEVHIGSHGGGSPVEFMGEVHEVPQELAPGRTDVEVTFRQVDGM